MEWKSEWDKQYAAYALTWEIQQITSMSAMERKIPQQMKTLLIYTYARYLHLHVHTLAKRKKENILQLIN